MATGKKKPVAKKAAKTVKPGTGKEAAAVRKQRFAEAYVANGGNATEAAKSVGYSPATARQQGSRLLSDVDVRAMVDQAHREQIEKVQRETGITLERTLREIAKGAFFDVRKLFDADGNPKPITDLDDDTASVIAGLEVGSERSGRGEDASLTEIRKYKLADRKGYLDMLMKHLGGYKKDNEQGGSAFGQALGATISMTDAERAVRLAAILRGAS